ncbi:MAG TPA: isochorismatase family protein [Minicystis sp.]|nr:isochorismatase family protein [Minicystis sp.]
MRRFEASDTAVVVVDVQEKLAGAMPPPMLADVTRSATLLLEACAVLGAHAIATEQYPRGLGHTIAPLAERLAELRVHAIEKMCFSACESAGFERAFAASRARAAVVVGMETHVCVFQTVRELCARGVPVLVPIDGVASRRADHRDVGLELCRQVGATVTTTETIVFDWLRVAGTDAFKRLSKLIR